MKKGIIIPCGKESSPVNFKCCLQYAIENKDTILCFVTDGSSNNFRSILSNIKNLEHENIHIYNLDKKEGKARVIQEGALYLFRETEAEMIGFIEGDFGNNLRDYKRLEENLYENNSLKIIYSSRINTNENLIRKVIDKVFWWSINNLLLLNSNPISFGTKIFRRKLIPIFNKISLM